MRCTNDSAEFSELLGKTLVSIENKDNKELLFKCADGTHYRMYHNQECSEHVEINSIVGDIQNLCNSPIIKAEEVYSYNQTPDGLTIPTDSDKSFTWTFYKLATSKGYVDIRWYGSSNGYYQNQWVDFEKMNHCK
jgi:hypothetical protein